MSLQDRVCWHVVCLCLCLMKPTGYETHDNVRYMIMARTIPCIKELHNSLMYLKFQSCLFCREMTWLTEKTLWLSELFLYLREHYRKHDCGALGKSSCLSTLKIDSSFHWTHLRDRYLTHIHLLVESTSLVVVPAFLFLYSSKSTVMTSLMSDIDLSCFSSGFASHATLTVWDRTTES